MSDKPLRTSAEIIRESFTELSHERPSWVAFCKAYPSAIWRGSINGWRPGYYRINGIETPVLYHQRYGYSYSPKKGSQCYMRLLYLTREHWSGRVQPVDVNFNRFFRRFTPATLTDDNPAWGRLLPNCTDLSCALAGCRGTTWPGKLPLLDLEEIHNLRKAHESNHITP